MDLIYSYFMFLLGLFRKFAAKIYGPLLPFENYLLYISDDDGLDYFYELSNKEAFINYLKLSLFSVLSLFISFWYVWTLLFLASNIIGLIFMVVIVFVLLFNALIMPLLFASSYYIVAKIINFKIGFREIVKIMLIMMSINSMFFVYSLLPMAIFLPIGVIFSPLIVFGYYFVYSYVKNKYDLNSWDSLKFALGGHLLIGLIISWIYFLFSFTSYFLTLFM